MNVIVSVINSNVSGCPQHQHPRWEMVYRLAGTSYTTINGKVHQISDGDTYLMPPHTPHSDEATHPYSDLVIHIDHLDFTDVLVLHDFEPHLSWLTQMIHRIMLKKEYNYQNIANNLMEAICQYIQQLSQSPYESPLVYKLKNILSDNIENLDFDLTQAIQSIGYHPDYIRRQFKAETQKTPLGYLTNLRINRAKQLLQMHNYENMERVAACCGFRDSFYFSTCFKKHTGISPLQYRKQKLLVE